jgi:phage terminase large subunit-like protein
VSAKASRTVNSGRSSSVKRTAHGRQRAKNVIDFIEILTVPSGTGQGKPFRLLKWQKDFLKDIYEPTLPDRRRVVRRAILSMARKNGKALALDTPIPTPNGWITMGDIREGDALYDERGALCRVIFATPVQLNRRCYRLHFADGTSIVADADHQWTVRSRSARNRKLTLTTEQMLHDVVLPYGRDDRIERNYSVRVAKAVQCQQRSLPVPPYTLGVWLGDGCTDSARISSSEKDHAILEAVAAEGVPVRRQRDGKTCTWWSLSDGVRDSTKDCIQKSLRALGVLHDKHIPSSYQRAAVEQRMALLQGLMDTDGYVSKAGQCELVSVIERLARDALELIRGLGFKATFTVDRAKLNGIDCGPRYRIQFWAYADRPVFRLARKRERLKRNINRARNARKYITAIEPTESVPVRCIQVDSSSKLFLAGEGFTPTHNTALIAAMALAHLVGPEAIPNGEIYSAANDRDQAAIVFKFARQIVELDAELRAKVEVIASTKTMLARGTGSIYRAISAEAGTKHGYMPSLVIYDELAQAKGRELYDVLDTSFGARDEPLFIVISTQSNDPEHVLSQLIDDGLSGDDPTIVCHLFAADEDCLLEDRAQWKKANPALGFFRDYDDLAASIEKATRMPSEEPKVRNLLLNQRVSPASILISRAAWMACIGDASFKPGEEVFLALDLSNTLDLSALLMGSADDVARVQPFFWKPADQLTEQSFRDFGSGNYRYLEWEKAGYIATTPGRSIDRSVIAKTIAELASYYRVRALAYDRWRIDDLLREFDRIGFASFKEGDRGDGLRLVPWGQGFKDMAPAIDALESAVTDCKLIHPNNPCLNWNMANAVAVMDPAGGRKLDKDKARFRIDGAVALAMLMGLRSRDRVKPLDIDTLIA